MATTVERPDGTRVDITENEGALKLVEAVNGGPSVVGATEAADDVEVEGIMTIGTHVITEVVEFNLRGSGWRFIRANPNEDGTTTVVLGR